MSCNCRMRKLLSFAPVLRFDRARRSPERARIDPIRMELQHLVVEISRGRRLGNAIEIADVLPGLLNDLGAVIVPRSLMSGHHSAWFERLNWVESGNPLAPRLRIGLGEIKMDAVVGGVTRYDHANRWNMQTGGVVNIGMSERHRDQILPLEVDHVFRQSFDNQKMIGNLTGKTRIPNRRKPLRRC